MTTSAKARALSALGYVAIKEWNEAQTKAREARRAAYAARKRVLEIAVSIEELERPK